MDIQTNLNDEETKYAVLKRLRRVVHCFVEACTPESHLHNGADTYLFGNLNNLMNSLTWMTGEPLAEQDLCQMPRRRAARVASGVFCLVCPVPAPAPDTAPVPFTHVYLQLKQFLHLGVLPHDEAICMAALAALQNSGPLGCVTHKGHQIEDTQQGHVCISASGVL